MLCTQVCIRRRKENIAADADVRSKISRQVECLSLSFLFLFFLFAQQDQPPGGGGGGGGGGEKINQ